MAGALACAEPDAPSDEGESTASVDESDDLEAASTPLSATWTTSGNGLDNTRHQPAEREMGQDNVAKLGVEWTFKPRGDIWATPALDEQVLYAPDSAGNLYAIDRRTGKQRWSRRITRYTNVMNDFARVTPAIAGDTLVLGNQAGRRANVGATVFAVDKRNGNKLWATKVDDHPAAIITQSPVVHDGRVYVGVSSWEEFRAPGAYKCCSFRGSMVALDLRTGQIVWKTYMTPGPEAPGYTGVAIWGSTAVVDAQRGSLYITTGNNYGVPTAVLDCQALPSPEQQAACVAEVPGAEQNYFDSVLALDLATGKVKWVHRASQFDSFNGACFIPGTNECRNPYGKDTDFGQGAMLYTVTIGGRTRQLLGAGQKSGVFWALNPDDGSVVWKTQVGPGGLYGGLEWGSATDGKRIYTSVANSDSQPWTMPTGEVIRSGLWAALDAATGKIVWETRGTPAVNGANRGAVSVANGVVYGGTFEGSGTMYAFSAETGKTLWTYRSGGTVNSAPAIADGTLYWGSGYSVLGVGGSTNKKLFAFKVGATNGQPQPPEPESDAGPPPAGSWGALYATYFGPGTVGHCNNCHAEMGSAATGYAFLQSKGQISGARSKLVGAGSVLTWFGGNMPPAGPTSYPEAERDLKAWVAAGAPND